MNFKKGDLLKCVDNSSCGLNPGELYEAQSDSYFVNGGKAEVVRVECMGYVNPFSAERFELYRDEIPGAQPNEYTLSDFDRIRLETAAVIESGIYGHTEYAALNSLKAADELINLIMNNPFKRTV